MRICFVYYTKLPLSKTDENKLRMMINKVVKVEKKKISNINLVFCDDEFIRDYNKRFLNHDYETDILTFHDVNDNGFTEGELLISAITVKRNSIKFKIAFKNELNRVVLHGILHLCGYNDLTNPEKALIRKRENYYLKNI